MQDLDGRRLEKLSRIMIIGKVHKFEKVELYASVLGKNVYAEIRTNI